MLAYQVGRRISGNEHGQRKQELFEQQEQKCAECGNEFENVRDGVRHHPQMISQGGTDLPGLGNEVWICHKCHEHIHPWLKRVL